ncbi:MULTISPECIES: ABC transporter ATP-binding protein [Paenibacillus]|uniref:ABC transporter ATP-binding protein n=1 Tax=Paenibacillus TaxID=44249 RepID=UPI0022B90525|nr:ABC transporter ATP-binding protein [Paenibacillus caseinilyticus]MCZ8519814.1 ABC transporter ATP-binding protein [Paenibacillus caseinilyticus]
MFKLPGIPVRYAEALEALLAAQEPAGAGRPKPKVRNLKSTLRRIWSYLAGAKLILSLVCVLVVVSSVLSLLSPYWLGIAIDTYLVDRDAAGLLLLLGGLAAVYLVQTGATVLQNYLMIGTAQRAVAAMRSDVFAQLQRLPIPYFAKRQHGELMSRFTSDIDNVSQTLSSSFIQICSSVITFTGMLAVMLWLSPLLTLITMTVVPVMFLGMKWITRRTGRLFRAQQKEMGAFNGFIEETLSGQLIVKTFGREEQAAAMFGERNRRLQTAAYWAQTYSGFISKLMIMLNNMSFALIAAAGGVLAYQGFVTIGVIITFTEYARQFVRPLNDLATQYNTLLAAVAGAERAFEILDEEEEKDEPGAAALTDTQGDIEFRGVTFAYGEGEPTLADLNFRVKPGQTAALVGSTGAGKTTIVQLLTRFYDIRSGQILIDGQDIRSLQRAGLRRLMGFVLQDSVLFDASIRENIRYGRLDATDEEVEQAAKLANAHGFISKLPQGYDTSLHQGGSGISHGQKQLLAIARAMLADPAILILDEATSSIDTVTEVRIQEALSRLMQGRTNLVIAHRLNTIRQADLIIVLDRGRVAEMGSHEELIGLRGAYYGLYEARVQEEDDKSPV